MVGSPKNYVDDGEVGRNLISAMAMLGCSYCICVHCLDEQKRAILNMWNMENNLRIIEFQSIRTIIS